MLLRPLILTAVLLAVGPAIGSAMGPVWAQGFTPAPSQGFGPPPGGAAAARPNPFDNPPQQQEPPCFKEFSALRTETENRGKAIQAAGKKKVSPDVACKLFNSLLAAEVKMIKFTEENSKTCGIPPQVTTTLKEGHGKVKEVRDRVCQAAAAGPRPSGPTLSDALGTSRLPDSSNIRPGKGGGTFDTLTGSPIGQK
jgi:hypothetical protein